MIQIARFHFLPLPSFQTRIAPWNLQDFNPRQDSEGYCFCYKPSVFQPSKMFRYDSQLFNWSS